MNSHSTYIPSSIDREEESKSHTKNILGTHDNKNILSKINDTTTPSTHTLHKEPIPNTSVTTTSLTILHRTTTYTPDSVTIPSTVHNTP